MVGTPHWAILPWARYCRIDPLGLKQNARWTDLLLATGLTGLTGQLRKGQCSSHWSTDWCTLNTHRSYRDMVILVPVTPGTPGQTRCNRSHREYQSHRVHHPQWAILSWACYCRIDPLGLNQNARWTDLLLATGHRSATKRSVQQSSVNRPVHSEHSPVTLGPRNTGTGQTSTRYRHPVPVNTGYTGYTGSDQAQPVRKLKRYRPTSAWTSMSYLFLIYRSDRYK